MCMYSSHQTLFGRSKENGWRPNACSFLARVLYSHPFIDCDLTSTCVLQTLHYGEMQIWIEMQVCQTRRMQLLPSFVYIRIELQACAAW